MQTDLELSNRGVLWKRRDVFKNSWRPRWFDLQPDQGLITYYLLTSNSTFSGTSASATVDSSITSSIIHPPYQRSYSTDSSLQSSLQVPRDIVRSRATSWDSVSSNVSENSVDYDVVPRGSIYLWDDICTVSINEALSKPREKLYAFTIHASERSNNDSSQGDIATAIHLAARTPEIREMWVRKIHQVCMMGQSGSDDNISNGQRGGCSSPSSTPAPSIAGNVKRRRSNSRGRLIQHEQYVQRQEPILEETNADIHSTGGGDIDESFSDLCNPVESPQRQSSPSRTHAFSSPILSWDTSDLLHVNAEVYSNVPVSLSEQIREKLNKCLMILFGGQMGDNNDNICDPVYEWKRLSLLVKSEHKHLNLVAYECQFDSLNGTNGNAKSKRYNMIKCEATLPHPAKQVFNLVADASKRTQYESSIRLGERIKQYNSHTFVDYYASMAVWPTAAREFVVAVHWQVLTRSDGEKAIAMISFSCPEAEASRPVSPHYVRATLIVSMYLIRDMGDDECHITRLLSFDLAGSISQKLSNVVMTQQANMPAVIFDFLRKSEPGPFDSKFRSSELLSNEDVLRNVIERSLETRDCAGTIDSIQMPTMQQHDDIVEDNLSVKDSDDKNLAFIGAQAIALLAPVMLHRIFQISFLRGIATPVFCVSAFLAVRVVILLQLRGIMRPISKGAKVHGSLKFRITVDLKGVLRFIANKKEERDVINSESADVSVVHIVAAAVARALRKEHGLKSKRFTIPWLFIDELVDASSDPVNVSVLENSVHGTRIVSVKSADLLDVQSIASALSRASSEVDPTGSSCTRDICDCIVVSNPTEGDDETEMMELDISPFAGSGISVVALLGEVRLDRRIRTSKSPGIVTTPRSASPRPVLSISLTFLPMERSPSVDVGHCRRVADEIRKLLQFPEMCDGQEY